MSDYCDDCHYAHGRKTGERACPFNSLYWEFLDRQRSRLENNPRIGMMYKTWDRMKAANREAIIQQAQGYRKNLDKL
jgi:deoxyribodipyrimidine photolyase-related protein